MNRLLVITCVVMSVLSAGVAVDFNGFPFRLFGEPEVAECDYNVTRFTPHDACNKFYVCSLSGRYLEQDCPYGTVWNQFCPLEGRCLVATEEQLVTCEGHLEKVQFADQYLNWTGQAPRDPTIMNPWCNWECGSGEYIPNWAVCDNITQCVDGSDEKFEECALPCDEKECNARSDCLCASTAPPGGLDPADVPQMVIIGWDSAIRLQQDFRWFMNLVFSKNAGRDRRVNPNGCPAVGTFFPTHIYSDLYGLQYLYYQGHEMSTLSITQKLPSQWWSRASIDQLNEEISNHRVILDLFSGVNPATVQGARMPYLEVNNNYFQMLIESGFSWDSSLPTQQVSPPMWPHTLDFRTPLTDECIVLGCPTLTFPGLWEFPLIDWTHPNGTICGNVPDACPHYDTEKETYEWLRVNYDRHARGNRAPFTLNLRAAWFEADLIDYGGTGARAMSRFLDELEADDSVYFVSVSQALAWMRNPTPLSTIRSFAPWLWCDADGVRKDLTLPLCTVTQATEQCVYNVTQPYWQEPQEVSYYTCAECSPEWPSPGNPRGDPRL